MLYDSLLRLYDNYGWECDDTHIWNIFVSGVNGIEDITESRLAKLYTMLGEENNKRENYKIANSYFQKILDIATLKEDIIEARVHITRNNMDMCDVVDIDEAKALLGSSIIEYLDIVDTYPAMDYEIGFIVCQNLGRCFGQSGYDILQCIF